MVLEVFGLAAEFFCNIVNCGQLAFQPLKPRFINVLVDLGFVDVLALLDLTQLLNSKSGIFLESAGTDTATTDSDDESKLASQSEAPHPDRDRRRTQLTAHLESILELRYALEVADLGGYPATGQL